MANQTLTLSLASPYLMSLGLSKSHISVVFVAGPLSGLIIQPLVGMSSFLSRTHAIDLALSPGVMSDHSESRFGRRRPYMLVASVICSGSLLLLGFSSSIATMLTGSSESVRSFVHSYSVY